MQEWTKIARASIKILLIVLFVGMLSACASSSDEPSQNGIADCSGSADCEPDHSDKDCMGCQIFTILFNAINLNYRELQKVYSEGAPTMMMIAFAVWLALRLLKYVSSVTENNISEIWNEILRKIFICTICIILVSSTTTLNTFINTFIMPIFMAFLDLGVKIIQATTSLQTGSTSATLFGETMGNNAVNFSCSLDSLTFNENGIPVAFKNTIICIFSYLKDNISLGGKIGWKAMQQSSGALSWLIGGLMWLCFLVVKVCFVFYFVDCIFQMGIILLLLPIFIMSYAFKPTRKWASSAFNYIIATSSYLMCFSILIAMVIRAMIELVSSNPDIFNPDGEAHTSDISIGFLCMMLIGWLVVGSMGVANQLSNSLIGGKSGSNFQKKLKAVAQAAGQALWRGIKALVSWGATAFPDTMIAKVHRQVKAMKEKINKTAGRT